MFRRNVNTAGYRGPRTPRERELRVTGWHQFTAAEQGQLFDAMEYLYEPASGGNAGGLLVALWLTLGVSPTEFLAIPCFQQLPDIRPAVFFLRTGGKYQLVFQVRRDGERESVPRGVLRAPRACGGGRRWRRV